MSVRTMRTVVPTSNPRDTYICGPHVQSGTWSNWAGGLNLENAKNYGKVYIVYSYAT
jgi:hypothetical protein